MSPLSLKKSYSAEIAPVGQTDSQAPQSMQASPITYLLSPSSIAPVGQVAAQEPHITHSSEITCMLFTSKYILTQEIGFLERSHYCMKVKKSQPIKHLA